MVWTVEEADDDWQGATSNDIAQLIYGKIAAGVSTKVEVPGLRPFRELLQNADDAKSTCLSFRFDSDMLLVHNDGFTMEEEFLQNIQIINKASKKNEPDTSGTFGTGFRSTYLYSDEPEMEWIHPKEGEEMKLSYRVFGIPLGMFGQLTWNKVKFGKHTLDQHYKTFGRETEVFEDGSSRLGVMFRFPWRVENQWEHMPEWSEFEWSREDVSGLASDFKEYALKALLGCRHLKTIRVVCAGCETPSKRWDYVVTRDRTVSEIREDNPNYPDDIDTEMHFSSATFTRDDSFYDLSGKGFWKRSPDSGHGWYDSRGLPEEVDASPDCRRLGYGIYGTAVSKDLSKRENFWDIALLALPLSPDAPSLPVYTPVPLASLTGNRFGIIAMLPPIENRLGIDISGSFDYRRNWLKRNIDVAAKLYEKRIFEHIEKIGERVDGAAAESTVISCLPRNAPSKWFATRGIEELAEMTPEKTKQTPFRKVIEALGWLTGNSAKMAWSKGSLKPLKDTVHYWSENESQSLEEVLEILDAPALSGAWKDYWEEVRGSSNFFYNAVKDQLFTYNDGGRYQRYGSKSLSSPLQFAKTVSGSWENARESDRLDRLAEILLGGVCTEHLVEEWGKEHPLDIMEIPCIISQDDRLRRIANFYDTESVPELIHILNPSGLVKEGDRKAVFETLRAPKTKLAKAIRDATIPTGRVILKLIHADTEARPEVHDDLEGNPVVYKAVSELLEKALEENTDKVRNDLDAEDVKFLRFVPCRRHGRVMTLQGNILEAESKESAPHRSLEARTRTWGFTEVWSGHTFLTRQYHREFIFREMPPDVDALPECVVRRLRFIALHEDVDDPDKVQKRLKLNVVGNPPAEGVKMKQTNLVRTLLFEHGADLIGDLQPSLFREGEFKRWLTGQPEHLSSLEQKDLEEGGSACAERWLAEIDGIDLDEAKTSLLVKLLSPYGDKVSGGLGVKNATKDEKNQELLFVLGEDGLWKHGSRFCLALDSELTEFVDEVAAVDESLMPPNLSLTILQQLGVQESLSPSIALPAVRKCLSEKNADALALILGSLASSPTHWMGTDAPMKEQNAWDNLTNQIDWIPTVGGALLRPDLVLKPDETHRELLGEGYENFPAKSTWAKLEGEHAGDRIAELGMRGEVEDGLLLLAYCGKHTSGNDPGLAIRELAKRIKKRVQPEWDKLVWGPHDKINRDDFVVYTRDGDSFTLGEYFQVWVTDTKQESEELKELWPSAEAVPLDRMEYIDSTVLEAVRKLGLLKQGPSYNDILDALTEPADYETAGTLWKRLCRNPPPDPMEEKERIGANAYRDNNRNHWKARYPYGGKLLSRNQITLTDDTDMHGETNLDEKTLICPGRISGPEGANLKAWLLRLGVEEEGEEDPSKVLGRLSGNTYDIESQRTTLHAIKRKIAAQDPKEPRHLLRWSPSESVKLVRLLKQGGGLEDTKHQLIDPQDNHPEIIRRFAENKLPLIHSEDSDPPEYQFWLTQLDAWGVTPFSSLVSHEVITHDIDDRYQRQVALELAISQSVRAMSLSYPKEFETDDEFTIECWIGSGGIPRRMVVEWKGSRKGIRLGFEDNACVYEGGGLRMFIDQDERKGGNSVVCSRLLIDALVSDDCPWFPGLKRRYAEEGARFLNKLKILLQDLLDSPTDEWEDISIATRGEGPVPLGAKLDEAAFTPKPHRRLFETNTEREMRLKMKGAYGGCQICRRVTPMSETTDETNESLIHIIKSRGQYYGNPDESRPMGRQLWLCARHRILWDRKLIRFQFMDVAFEGEYSRRGHIPSDVLKRGLEKLEKHRDDWKEGSDMRMMVYDSNLEHEETDIWGPEEGSEEFDLHTNWRERNMIVTKKHAQGILDQIIGWLMHDQGLH